MRVFVAGASGAIGRRLVPQLIDAGHEVTAASAQLDLRNRDAVRAAVREHDLDAIVHLTPARDLGTAATDALLAAAWEASVPRFVPCVDRASGPAAALARLERAVADFRGIVLRYGCVEDAASATVACLSA